MDLTLLVGSYLSAAGLITGTRIAAIINKCFNQYRTRGMNGLPIILTLPDHRRPGFTGQIRRLDPGQNEKARVIND